MHSWLSQLGPPPISLRWAEGSKLLWDLSVARRLRLLVTWTKCAGVRSITLCVSVCIRLSYHYFLRAVPARVVSQAMFFILVVLPCELYELSLGGGEPPSHPSMGQHSCAKVFGSMDPTEIPLGQICIYILQWPWVPIGLCADPRCLCGLPGPLYVTLWRMTGPREGGWWSRYPLLALRSLRHDLVCA